MSHTLPGYKHIKDFQLAWVWALTGYSHFEYGGEPRCLILALLPLLPSEYFSSLTVAFSPGYQSVTLWGKQRQNGSAQGVALRPATQLRAL